MVHVNILQKALTVKVTPFASGELLTMNDSYGDGWNGAVLTINGVDYTVADCISYSMC